MIGSIYWFLNFPLYRYGYSLFVSGVIILISHSISNYFTNNKKLKTFDQMNKVLIIFFIFVIAKNFLKIGESLSKDYVDYPWPKIYAFDEKNIKQRNLEMLSFKNLKIYRPEYRLCMYSSSPCTNFIEIKDQVKIKELLNYYIIIPKS